MNANFKQNYTQKCSLVLKWPIILVVFYLKGKSRFFRFPPKKYFNIPGANIVDKI